VNRILVATDFSDPAAVAVEQAVALARRSDAELVVAHATNVAGAEPDLFERLTGRIEDFRREVREDLSRRRRRLDHLRDELAAGGVRVAARLLDGAADEAIADAARELPADLVVAGTRRGPGPILLGSVAERILRASPCPVLVARPPVIRGGFGRILVATDFEPEARVDVFHAVTAEEPEDPYVLGDRLIAPHRDAGVHIAFLARAGKPGHGIIERLDQFPRYDVVALGTHGRRGWQRFWLGSIAEAVVRHAPCSALVVPPADAWRGARATAA
jgi:nucleotide-binding universal stress UspA family protein